MHRISSAALRQRAARIASAAHQFATAAWLIATGALAMGAPAMAAPALPMHAAAGPGWSGSGRANPAGASTAAAVAATPAGALIDGGRYGSVRVLAPPADAVRAYVVLFSDRGWTSADQDTLQAIAATGALAVGVDTDVYLARMASDRSSCEQLVGDAENLSWQLQRRYGHGNYRFPILAGTGAGGTIAWVTLTQAPGHTLGGAITLDPAATLASHLPLCAGAAAHRVAAHRYRYGAVPRLNGFWTVALDAAAPSTARRQIQQLQRQGMPLQVVNLSAAPAQVFAQLLAPHLARLDAPAPGHRNVDVAALPLIELPAARPSPLLAVVLSGDGGWRDIDKSIAEDLRRDGINVVGWDSVRYFWRHKTPQQTAADLADVLDAYLERWHTRTIALIGYSFGADVLPAVYDALPPPLRARVVLISLMGFEARADWEIQVSGWLGSAPSAAATAVMPALATIAPALLQCFYGAEETDSACPQLADSGAQLVRTPGGHHFGGGYEQVEQRILKEFMQRAARGPAASSVSAPRSTQSTGNS